MDAHVFNIEVSRSLRDPCAGSNVGCSFGDSLDEVVNKKVITSESIVVIASKQSNSACIGRPTEALIATESVESDTIESVGSADTHKAFEAINILVIGDFGEPNRYIQEVAGLMNHVAIEKSPQFIIALGDNIYDVGCETEDDPKFQTHWSDLFLKPYESLRIPWKIALGNHDYGENPYAQVRFTNSKKNPHGLWQCPNNVYDFSLDRRGLSIDEDRRSDDRLVEFFCMDTNG